MNGKIALGALGGIGLITTVSVVSSGKGSSDPSWAKEMPAFSFLSADETFMDITQGNSSYRFGYMYAEFLVGDAETNNDWWKWSYENLKEDLKNQGVPSADSFKVSQDSPQIPNTVGSLKNWCREIYKTNVGSQKPFDAPNSIFNNASVWKYCSPIQQIPVSLEKSGVTYPEKTVGKEIGKRLLALEGNDRIWHYRNKFFNGISVDKFEEELNSEAFKEGRKNGRKIKDICADAYGQKIPGLVIQEIMFFCSISQLI